MVTQFCTKTLKTKEEQSVQEVFSNHALLSTTILRNGFWNSVRAQPLRLRFLLIVLMRFSKIGGIYIIIWKQVDNTLWKGNFNSLLNMYWLLFYLKLIDKLYLNLGPRLLNALSPSEFLDLTARAFHKLTERLESCLGCSVIRLRMSSGAGQLCIILWTKFKVLKSMRFSTGRQCRLDMLSLHDSYSYQEEIRMYRQAVFFTLCSFIVSILLIPDKREWE